MGLTILQTVLIFWLSIKITKKTINSQHPKWGFYAVLLSIPVTFIVNIFLDFMGFEISELGDYSLEAYLSDLFAAPFSLAATIGVFALIMKSRKTKNRPLKPDKKLGGFFVFIQVIWILNGISIFIHEMSMDLQGLNEETHIILDTNIGLFSWMVGMGYILYLKKRTKLVSVEELLEKDHRPPVLFLRSFETESKRVQIPFRNFFSSTFRNMIGYTFDEYLERDITKKIGPFIALGRPGDYLPMPGAARSYVHDENWQETIANYCEKASAIIFLESLTEGAKWELEHIRSRIGYKKLVVVTFPKKFKYNRKSWPHFYEILNKTGIHVPSVDPGCGAVLSFNECWQSTVLLRNAKRPAEIVETILSNSLNV